MNSIIQSIAKSKREGKIIGFTASSFDLLHAGHIIMLEEAKSKCDILVCGLQSDPTIDREEKNRPVQNLFERFVQLDAVKYVDFVIPYSTETDLRDLLLSVIPDVRIVGEEYRSKDFTGKHDDVKIEYNQRKHSFSSTSLRSRVAISESSKTKVCTKTKDEPSTNKSKSGK